mmetsp:Transcript_96304/g.215631  ORF Transcript_96304/g.215631 Transcript_96304/m.215631 type:complete len:189 (-) Transcript_96304:14-580(-)
MQRRDHYEVLGVPHDAPRARIRRAYLELAKETHPDLYHGSAREGVATAAFGQVQKAYKVLSDPDLRRAYDAAIAEGLVGVAQSVAPTPQQEPQQEARSRGPIPGPSAFPEAPAAGRFRLGLTWPRFSLRRVQTKYRHFSQHRPVAVAMPLAALVGVFVTFRVLPMGMVMLSSEESCDAPSEGRRTSTS